MPFNLPHRLLLRGAAAAFPLFLSGCLLIDPLGLPGQFETEELSNLAFRARTGDLNAQLELGKRFEEGRGVPMNLATARRLYRSAAAGEITSILVPETAAGGGSPDLVEYRYGPHESTGLPEARERLARLEARLSGRSPGQGPATMPEPSMRAHNAQRLGSWLLRNDPAAHSRDAHENRRTGVIELRARTSDGAIRWLVLDNGRRLIMSVVMPHCSMSAQLESYEPAPGLLSRVESFASQFDTLPEYCSVQPHRDELQRWVQDFPAAIEAMKERARAIYGAELGRCTWSPSPGTNPWPRHPPCGTGPHEIE